MICLSSLNLCKNLPKIMNNIKTLLIISIIILGSCSTNNSRNLTSNNPQNEEIMHNDEHPGYWQYKGESIMLLGGSVEDNLFQLEDVESHLDLLRSVGGNYVRNTLSCRDSGNVWPFRVNDNGLYDLNTWNEEYWKRLDRFFKATAERDIIVQMEMWAVITGR